MQASNVLQADVIFVQGGHFLFQVASEELHQEVHFSLGTAFPVFFRKGIQRERWDAYARGALHHVTH
jgi:hypothetical protein